MAARTARTDGFVGRRLPHRFYAESMQASTMTPRRNVGVEMLSWLLDEPRAAGRTYAAETCFAS